MAVAAAACTTCPTLRFNSSIIIQSIFTSHDFTVYRRLLIFIRKSFIDWSCSLSIDLVVSQTTCNPIVFALLFIPIEIRSIGSQILLLLLFLLLFCPAFSFFIVRDSCPTINWRKFSLTKRKNILLRSVCTDDWKLCEGSWHFIHVIYNGGTKRNKIQEEHCHWPSKIHIYLEYLICVTAWEFAFLKSE